MSNIERKVVVITGASSGLGEASAQLLSANGASVVLGARRQDRIQLLADALTAGGGKAMAVTTDVTRCDEIKRLVDAAVQTYGRIECDDQQCRTDAAVAARASQDRRMGPDDRREHQGSVVRHCRSAAAYEAAERRAHHQCVVGGRPQGPRRRRGLCGDQARRAGAIRRAAPGSEGLQYPYDGDLAGRGGDRTAERITEPDVAENFHKFYEEFAIPADSFARAVAFAINEPDDVDINEILFRPTRQEL